MMNTDNKITIAISNESKDIEPHVRDAFSGLDCDVNSNYSRKSADSLPTQIMIFLGGAILSGATWDIIKFGIGKLFRRYDKITVTIRDNNGTMFTVKRDWKIVVLVVPDRQKEFSKIKNIYSLGKYLVTETEADKLEHRKRLDTVLGLAVAGILGWLINIFSNIYYDVFLTHNAKISSYNAFHLLVLLSLMFLVVAFLQFLVYDYKNELTLGKSFWVRYMFFVSEDSSLSRFARLLNKFFVSMFLIIINLGILSVLYNSVGYLSIFLVLLGSIIVVGIISYIRKRLLKRGINN